MLPDVLLKAVINEQGNGMLTQWLSVNNIGLDVMVLFSEIKNLVMKFCPKFVMGPSACPMTSLQHIIFALQQFAIAWTIEL